MFIPAYADSTDPSSMNLLMILAGAFILAATAALAAIPIFAAKSRRPRQSDLITALTLLWALLTAASLIYSVQAQMSWKTEYTVRLMSGYLDPKDTTDAPKLPWKLWTGLGVTYAGLIGWTVSKRQDGPMRNP